MKVAVTDMYAATQPRVLQTFDIALTDDEGDTILLRGVKLLASRSNEFWVTPQDFRERKPDGFYGEWISTAEMSDALKKRVSEAVIAHYKRSLAGVSSERQ